ncbi:MAG: hypothetical protein IKB91_02890 [Anaerotignum sp.]|nr:hypothetical protein [Anaerotignum sp.]
MKFDDLFDANGIFLTTEHYILRRILPREKKNTKHWHRQKVLPSCKLQKTPLHGKTSFPKTI